MNERKRVDKKTRKHESIKQKERNKKREICYLNLKRKINERKIWRDQKKERNKIKKE